MILNYVVLALLAFLGVAPGRRLDAGDIDAPLFFAFLKGLLSLCLDCFAIDDGARESSRAFSQPAFWSLMSTVIIKEDS